MNQWMRDGRIRQAEQDAFEAERAERRADFSRARSLYLAAGEAIAAVAIAVPADHPNTRSDLAIAAVASLARAGDLGRAVEFGRRVLVEVDALSEHGYRELGRLVSEYEKLIRSSFAPSAGRARRDEAVRNAVRKKFESAA